jgi:hypothetical protein
LPQFESQAGPVCRFQKPWSYSLVHLDGSSDDAPRNLIELVFFFHRFLGDLGVPGG